MASVFVWSGASGANDGSTWEDAYTTLFKDWGATITPGTDQVYIRSVHSESLSGSQTITGSTATSQAPVDIRCVVGDTTGTTPGNLATGASVGTTTNGDLDINEGIYIYGVSLVANNHFNIATSAGNHDVVLEQCLLDVATNASLRELNIGSGNNGIGTHVKLLNTDVDFHSAGGGIDFINPGLFEWVGGSIVGSVDPTHLINSYTGRAGSKVVFRDVDMSSLGTNLIDISAIDCTAEIIFSRCLLGTGLVVGTTNVDRPGVSIRVMHCQIGTDADPSYQVHLETIYGKTVSQTATYRTGGASDGERTNPISWDMDTTVGSRRSYPGYALESTPIIGWTDGDGSTAHTYRVYFASGGTQQDDDIWFDLTGPNDAATNSLGVRNTTRVAPEGTPANYTTDGSSTWTGSDVGTKQYMEITYTPDKPGPISAVIHMVTDAGSTGHIFVDPIIVVDP